MRVNTVRQLIDTLGNIRDAAGVLGVSPQVVIHWRNAGHIPPSYFLPHQKALRTRQIEAPRHLWRCGHCGQIVAAE